MTNRVLRSVVMWVWLSSAVGAQQCGDCDQDGASTILDALLAAKAAVHLWQPTSSQLCRCDVWPTPGDSLLSVVDALHIAQSSAGMKALACEQIPRRWRRLGAPEDMLSGELVFDPVRRVLVALGWTGTLSNVGPSGGSWELLLQEWDGQRWIEPCGSRGWPGNVEGAVAWDGQGVVVMGGGPWQTVRQGGLVSVVPAETDEMWRWDGAAWEQLFPAPRPSPRHGANACFQESWGRVLLMGGSGGYGSLADCWEWDGASEMWTQVPSPSSLHRLDEGDLVHDSIRQVTVWLTEGVAPETWEWDGTQWTQAAPVRTPTGVGACSLAFDAVRGRVVARGKRITSGGASPTWEYDGVSWHEVSDSTDSSSFPGLTFHPDLQEVVRFGGYDSGGALINMNELHAWDGQVWRVAHSVPAQPQRREHAEVATIPGTSDILMYGGIRAGAAGTMLDETWRWSAGQWREIQSGVHPPARARHALATDPLTGGIVLFGGAYETPTGQWVEMQDTWVFDPVQERWTELFPARSPGARSGQEMCLHEASGNVVLFGGGGPMVDRETWIWDGSTWSQVFPSTVPPARFSHSMTYVASRQTVVMAGGNNADPGFLADVWEWTGADWTRAAIDLPAPAMGPGLTHDPLSGELLVFGGYGDGGLSYLPYAEILATDDFQTWRVVGATPRPPGSDWHDWVEYDELSGGLRTLSPLGVYGF